MVVSIIHTVLCKNIIQFVTITTTGNAADFGDLHIEGQESLWSSSDSHGGYQNEFNTTKNPRRSNKI